MLLVAWLGAEPQWNGLGDVVHLLRRCLLLFLLLLLFILRCLLIIVGGLPIIFGRLILALGARHRLIHLIAVLIFVVSGILVG